MMEQESTAWVFLLSTAVVVSLLILIALFWFGWWVRNRLPSVSPYTGSPLRRAADLSFSSREKVINFLKRLNQFDNSPFDFWKAAFCRDTGRIFQDCIDWTGSIVVDWTFLDKRHPGNYISWGALADDQKRDILESHGSLEGFQTEVSSPQISPRAIEPIYTNTKPGPLYVDLHTKTVLGWVEIPETDLEVLIVQKPLK